MSQAFFAPNKSMTGGAILASFNSKDANVYFKAAKQVNNNPDKKNFDFQNAVNFKFSADEAAGIFRAIRTCSEFKFIHSFTDQSNVKHTTSGSFRYYNIPSKTEGVPNKEGYGFTGNKDGNTYKCGFTLDSAERLAQYLQFALNHIFSADYSEDKKRAEEFAAKKNAESKPTQKPTAKSSTKTPPKVEVKQDASEDEAPSEVGGDSTEEELF